MIGHAEIAEVHSRNAMWKELDNNDLCELSYLS